MRVASFTTYLVAAAAAEAAAQPPAGQEAACGTTDDCPWSAKCVDGTCVPGSKLAASAPGSAPNPDASYICTNNGCTAGEDGEVDLIAQPYPKFPCNLATDCTDRSWASGSDRSVWIDGWTIGNQQGIWLAAAPNAADCVATPYHCQDNVVALRTFDSGAGRLCYSIIGAEPGKEVTVYIDTKSSTSDGWACYDRRANYNDALILNVQDQIQHTYHVDYRKAAFSRERTPYKFTPDESDFEFCITTEAQPADGCSPLFHNIIAKQNQTTAS